MPLVLFTESSSQSTDFSSLKTYFFHKTMMNYQTALDFQGFDKERDASA